MRHVQALDPAEASAFGRSGGATPASLRLVGRRVEGLARRDLDSTVLDDAVATTQDTITQLIGVLRAVIREVVNGTDRIAAVHCTAHDCAGPGMPSPRNAPIRERSCASPTHRHSYRPAGASAPPTGPGRGPYPRGQGHRPAHPPPRRRAESGLAGDRPARTRPPGLDDDAHPDRRRAPLVLQCGFAILSVPWSTVPGHGL